MIRNEQEYKKAVQRIEDERKRHEEIRLKLASEGLTQEEVARVVSPLESFHMQLVEEVAYYEQLMRGVVDPIDNLKAIGHRLISLRIAQGITQAELAERLGVSASQISRDETHEYHGISVERADKILEALGASTHTTIDLKKTAA